MDVSRHDLKVPNNWLAITVCHIVPITVNHKKIEVEIDIFEKF